jgi:rod shape determining protein RodA
MFKGRPRDRTFVNRDQYVFQKLRHLPLGIIFSILMVSSIGFVMMYSAAGGDFRPWAQKQLFHFAIGFPLMILIAVVHIRVWYRLAYLSYLGCLLLLVIVVVIGHKAMGATRWIDLGVMKLQPSELMSICLVLTLARYFHGLGIQKIGNLKSLLPPIGLVLLPVALILKQPDLGTAIILLAIGGGVFFVAGVRLWKFALLIVLALVAAPIAWQFLHDYQKKRIMTFLDPERDPLGAGYNIIQSKIAIGSGGLFGKGLLNGSQSQLNFLPEHQTDFVFTMLAEELGFVGGGIVLILNCMIILFSFRTAVICKSHYGRLVAMGVAISFFLHLFINIAMVMGLLPVVGAPLPLISYGGTIMLATLIGFGFILNTHIHRNTSMHRDSIGFF